jgi:hypothetical protein
MRPTKVSGETFRTVSAIALASDSTPRDQELRIRHPQKTARKRTCGCVDMGKGQDLVFLRLQRGFNIGLRDYGTNGCFDLINFSTISSKTEIMTAEDGRWSIFVSETYQSAKLSPK